MYYHAHIYWKTPAQKEKALIIRDTLIVLGCEVGRVHDGPIGPHPLPMFQAIYNTDNKEAVETIINDMRRGLSILLHEAINDDVRDHTEGARWLGRKLKLNLTWLEEYTRNRNA